MISQRPRASKIERTLAESRLYKGMLAHVKEVGVSLREFRYGWRCAGARKRAMTWRTRQQHIVARKLGKGSIDRVEIRYEVPRRVILL